MALAREETSLPPLRIDVRDPVDLPLWLGCGCYRGRLEARAAT